MYSFVIFTLLITLRLGDAIVIWSLLSDIYRSHQLRLRMTNSQNKGGYAPSISTGIGIHTSCFILHHVLDAFTFLGLSPFRVVSKNEEEEEEESQNISLLSSPSCNVTNNVR